MCWPLSSVRSSMRTPRARPPSTRPASKRLVAWPASVSSTAAAIPAQPPPMTATRTGSALDPGRGRQPQLAHGRQRNALVQYLEVLVLDFGQQGAVDRRHDQAGALVLTIDRRQLGEGLLVITLGPLVLELHQGREIIRILAIQDIRRRDVELLQLLHRDVDAATPGILANVADDVGQLESHAQIVRVFLRLPILVAEDFGSEQADDAGHAVAIQRQALEVEIARLLEIHLHTVDDFQQLLLGQVDARSDPLQRLANWMLRIAFGNALHLLAPPRQFGRGDRQIVAFIDNIIHLAAESVERHDGLPALGGHEEK